MTTNLQHKTNPLDNAIEVSIAARILRRSNSIVLQLIHRGEIRAWKIGGRWLIDRPSILEYIKDRSNETLCLDPIESK